MDDFPSLLSAILMLAALFYVIYLRPKQEERREQLIFDNRVLATIDGLHLSGMKFGCTDFEMRAYAKRLLEKAHALPGNQLLLKHTTRHGYTFYSHTGLHGEHITFALLCIIDYAEGYDDQDLITQCEKLLKAAQIAAAHYHN